MGLSMLLTKIIILVLCYYVICLSISYIKFIGCDNMWDCNKHCENNNKNKCYALAKRDLFLLIGIIIFLLTLTFGDNAIAFSHFSFAGTITSIVLSVLAIFMTIQSEAKNENVKAEINTAVHSLNEVNNQFKENIENALNKLNNVDSNLDIKLNEINSKLDSINKNVNAINVPYKKGQEWVLTNQKEGNNNAKQ